VILGYNAQSADGSAFEVPNDGLDYSTGIGSTAVLSTISDLIAWLTAILAFDTASATYRLTLYASLIGIPAAGAVKNVGDIALASDGVNWERTAPSTIGKFQQVALTGFGEPGAPGFTIYVYLAISQNGAAAINVTAGGQIAVLST